MIAHNWTGSTKARLISGQGCRVFAISLTLPVTKENRNASHRTLPVHSIDLRQSLLKNTIEEQKAIS